MPSVASTPFLPLLVLCSFALLHSASSLMCYDCLSTALPTCLDDSNGVDFEIKICEPQEKVCSIIKMRDAEGNLVVGRQCATGPEEAVNLSNLLGAGMPTKLVLEAFKTCDTDVCNARRRTTSEGSKGGAATPTLAPWSSTAPALALAVLMAVLAR